MNIVLPGVLLAINCMLDVSPPQLGSLQKRPDVKNVTATVKAVPGESTVEVNVVNRSTLALHGWQIKLLYSTASLGPREMDVSYDGALDEPPNGPVAPGGNRSRRYLLVTPGDRVTAVSVSVEMALFEDLSVEGKETEADFLLRKREQKTAVLGALVDALQSVEGTDAKRARAKLQAVLASDPRVARDPTDSWSEAVRLTVEGLVNNSTTDQEFSQEISEVKQRFARQRDRGLRYNRR